MTQNTQNFKTLLDLAVQRGLFKDAKAVSEMQGTLEYFIGLENDFEQICNLKNELEKELYTFKGRAHQYNSERPMPSKSNGDWDSKPLSHEDHDKYFPDQPKRVKPQIES